MNYELSNDEVEFLIRCLVQNYAEEASDFNADDICDNGPTALLIGKFLSKLKNKYEIYNKFRKDRYLKDSVNEKLFLGNGYHSTVLKNKLHRRLEQAASDLCALEQNGGMGTEFNEQEDKECRESIKSVMLDLLCAFDLQPNDLMK